MPRGERRTSRKLARRYFSERYLTLLVLAFAVTVSLTRLFLEITGYPQIGGSQLHFAHVLWGGLVWFCGSLLPLLYANNRALDLSAIFTGIGSGLFIDEVGKFITRTNDYFYPAAAPIIYVFFLLVLLMLASIRRERALNPRERLYRALELFEEVLEEDLSIIEKNRLLMELDLAAGEDSNGDMARVASTLSNLLRDNRQTLVEHKPGSFEKLAGSWQTWLDRRFFETPRTAWLYNTWGLVGALSILHPLISLFAVRNEFSLPGLLDELIEVRLEPFWGIGLVERLRLSGEAVVGIFLMLAFALGYLGRRATAARIAYLSLLVQIVFINILVFFYDQFSAIFFATAHFLLLMFSRHYMQLLNLKTPESRKSLT